MDIKIMNLLYKFLNCLVLNIEDFEISFEHQFVFMLEINKTIFFTIFC